MGERLRDGTRSGLRAAGLTAGRGRTTKARCVCRLALTIVGLARDRCGLSIHMGTKTAGNSARKRPVPLASATRALAHSCGAISLANGRDEHRGILPNAVAAEVAKRALSALRPHPQVAQRRGPVRRPQAMPHQSWVCHLIRGWHPPCPSMRCGRLEPPRWGPLAASPDWRPRAGIRHRKRRLLAPSSHRIRSTPSLLARRASVQGHYLGVCKRRCGAIPPFCRHDRRTSTCSDRPGFDSPGERTPPAHAPCGNHRSCALPRSGVA